MSIEKAVLEGGVEAAAFRLTNGVSVPDIERILSSYNSPVVEQNEEERAFAVNYDCRGRAVQILEDESMDYESIPAKAAKEIF